jgi:hypothetical protein
MELSELVDDFARGMCAADAKQPRAASRTDAQRLYYWGIGPFGEEEAVALTVAEMKAARPGAYEDARKLRYPGSKRKTCDLAIGSSPDWAIEVKLARVMRDNGDYEATAIKKILSPYPDDRSAVTDCLKLTSSGFLGRKSVLIYGFDDPIRPLAWLIDAFELVAGQHVRLGPRAEASMTGLMHHYFRSGVVYAWEVLGPVPT